MGLQYEKLLFIVIEIASFSYKNELASMKSKKEILTGGIHLKIRIQKMVWE